MLFSDFSCEIDLACEIDPNAQVALITKLLKKTSFARSRYSEIIFLLHLSRYHKWYERFFICNWVCFASEWIPLKICTASSTRFCPIYSWTLKRLILLDANQFKSGRSRDSTENYHQRSMEKQFFKDNSNQLCSL